MPPESRRPSGDSRAEEGLKASWRRSAAAGLGEGNVPPTLLSRMELQAARERGRRLLKYGEPSMENTYEQLAGTHSVVVLSDADGVVLSSKGDADFMAGPHGSSFVPGVCLSEGVAGTNAVGTCIANRAPVAVDTVEHYLPQYRSICGSAAPIFDSAGLLLGVLAAYSTRAGSQALTLGLIRTVAVLIENRILVREMGNEILVHFHPVAEYIGTIKQGIAVFAADGKLIGSNTAARYILRLDVDEAPTKRFRDVFCSDFPLESLVEKARAIGSGQLTTALKDGREVSLIPSIGATGETHGRGTGAPDRPDLVSKGGKLKGPGIVLKDLDLGDALMHRAILKASMILGSDIPLLIEGESGVGKEVFTAAFHNSGPRQRGPFVAVNCAAIPEGLIESELFGYEEGAFTGAKKKGYEGRILQADGGTLFLDEIGDMPLVLQGRLLRVLQERQVTPLGSSRSVPVDVSLVCATHRNLRAEIASGRFREDLYYRLNGLRIQLPSLRERSDIDRLIDLVIDAGSSGRRIEIAPEVREALRTNPWPGNIRQLQMVMRTAMTILGRDTQLTLDHLPDEFILQEKEQPRASLQELLPEGDLAHIESEAIRRAMSAAEGNVSKAARTLGISRKTLYRKLAQMHTGSGSSEDDGGGSRK